MQINPQQFTWQIILNPNALLRRSRQYWKEIENKLQEVQINYLPHITSTIDESNELIIALCQKGERHFIIAGGDGTLNIFANAVMQSQVNHAEIFAALIPLGTGNDWSRTHGYPKSHLDAIDVLVKGIFIAHDLGLVETVVNDQIIDTRYFVNIAGFGFDGSVIFNASKKTNRFFHKQLYLINLLKTLLNYQSLPVTIKSKDLTVTKNIFTIAAGIGQYNGNGMRQCPEAIPDDGLFDVVFIEELSFFKVLRNINHLFKGAHVQKLKEVTTFRTDDFEIHANSFILGEVEGELLTTGNYRIRCLSSAINFLTSSEKKLVKTS